MEPFDNCNRNFGFYFVILFIQNPYVVGSPGFVRTETSALETFWEVNLTYSTTF